MTLKLLEQTESTSNSKHGQGLSEKDFGKINDENWQTEFKSFGTAKETTEVKDTRRTGENVCQPGI